MERYRRPLSLPAMNDVKQEALLSASVLVVAGADSAITVVKELASAGVGKITVIDCGEGLDFDGLKPINEDVEVDIKPFNDLDDLEKYMERVDIVVESVLDWQVKLGLSDRLMRLGKPLVHSGIVGYRYQVYCMIPTKSACLRCVLPMVGIEDFPLGKVKSHPLSSVETWAGALMALDVIKVVANLGVVQQNALWRLDPLSGDIEAIRSLTAREDCPDCGPHFKTR